MGVVLESAILALLSLALVGTAARLYISIQLDKDVKRSRFFREVGRDPRQYGFSDPNEFPYYIACLKYQEGIAAIIDGDPSEVLKQYPPSAFRKTYPY